MTFGTLPRKWKIFAVFHLYAVVLPVWCTCISHLPQGNDSINNSMSCYRLRMKATHLELNTCIARSNKDTFYSKWIVTELGSFELFVSFKRLGMDLISNLKKVFNSLNSIQFIHAENNWLQSFSLKVTMNFQKICRSRWKSNSDKRYDGNCYLWSFNVHSRWINKLILTQN